MTCIVWIKICRSEVKEPNLNNLKTTNSKRWRETVTINLPGLPNRIRRQYPRHNGQRTLPSHLPHRSVCTMIPLSQRTPRRNSNFGKRTRKAILRRIHRWRRRRGSEERRAPPRTTMWLRIPFSRTIRPRPIIRPKAKRNFIKPPGVKLPLVVRSSVVCVFFLLSLFSSSFL